MTKNKEKIIFIFFYVYNCWVTHCRSQDNVGFFMSKPKADTQVGGSGITVGDRKYTFGSLAYEFYYSGELADRFPYTRNKWID